MRGNRFGFVSAMALSGSVLLATGCAAPGLDSVPLPAPSLGSESFTVTAKFANALNLPAKGKVRLGGADIGEVDSMRAEDYIAVVTLRMRQGVRLPQGSTAELRTATPLGDVFVAIKAPVQPGPGYLKDGDTLALDETAAAATVEDVLSSAAVLVNGGAVRNLAKVVNGFGEAAGGNGAVLRDILDQSGQALATLDNRSEQIKGALDDLSTLAATLNARQNSIDDLLDASGPAVGAVDSTQVVSTVEEIGRISDQLAKLPSVKGTDTRGIIADLNTVSRAFNDVVQSPDTRLVSINRFLPILIKQSSGTAISADITVAKLALGNMPDIGYLGDTEFHGPKRADWDYLVGSFKYSLLRLQERVVGQKP
jgi:virulence factor Mce-like protein